MSTFVPRVRPPIRYSVSFVPSSMVVGRRGSTRPSGLNFVPEEHGDEPNTSSFNGTAAQGALPNTGPGQCGWCANRLQRQTGQRMARVPKTQVELADSPH